MARDRFDLLQGGVLVAATLALAALLAGGNGAASGRAGGELDRALQRELDWQARAALLQKLYGPVEELRRAGQLENALLKLDELERRYPGEAHGQILKGEILAGIGALEQALASYAAGVRRSGDYIDRSGPLTRRGEIERLVRRALPEIGARAALNPDNRTLAAAIRDLRYLQGRLAGGCE